MMYTSLHRLPAFVALAALFFTCADYRPHVDNTQGTTEEVAPSGRLEYSTFMVGDLGYDYARGLTTLEAMTKAMPDGKKKSSLLLLGDIVGKDGLTRNDTDEEAHLRALGQILERVPGKVYYTPGDNELGNRSDFGRLDRLEEFFDDEIKKKVKFMPNKQCSGPDDTEIHDRVGLIGVNSAWYLADWRNSDEISEGCDYKTRSEMTFALADEIKGYRDQVKIVMMHHPLQSNGNRGGKYSLNQHLFPLADVIPGAYVPLPVVGTVARAVQSVAGGRKDINNLQYQQMIRSIKAGIDDEVMVIFVGGHEHNMAVVHEEEYIKVTAGSGSVRAPGKAGNDANFVYGAVGYSRIDFYDSEEVYVGFYTVDEDGNEERVYYQRIIKDRTAPQDENIQEVPAAPAGDQKVTTSVYGEGSDNVAGLKEGLLGRHYRALYYQPLEVPVLDISTINGGLTPYRRGGGQTTLSLHTKGGDGHLYQLRSVRKNPSQILPSLLEKSFAADLAKDAFTSIHPYAPLTLPSMQTRLDLLGADPQLYYIPKQPALGRFNTNFGGEMYWLEQRPDEDWSGTRFFGGSKDIISNSDMREKVTESWKHYADQQNFARARLFDLWIGDWDRHRDQWRWAAFEEEDGRTRYVAVARDRDQVYGNYDGGLIGLARIFVPEARKLRPFTEDLDKAKWRAMNGKWNDRVFLNQVTREEMLAEARYIVQTITPEIIDEAMQAFPAEVRDYSLEREKIGDKLKNRLTQLERFAGEYYAVLAEKVTVLGTEKDDVFRVTGNADGTLHVQVFDADKEGNADEKYYDRVFLPSETKEVILYGLDGDDQFLLLGEDTDVDVRVIGGTDKDVVDAKDKLWAKAYDEKKGMDFRGNTGRIKDRRNDNHPEVNTYVFEDYYPDYTIPLPSLGFNVDDGIFVGMGFSRTIQGFRPDPYKQRYTLVGKYSTNEFWQVNLDWERNNLFGRRKDLVLNTFYRSPGYVANFFGLGNRGRNQPEEGEIEGLDDDNILDYNRARREEIAFYPSLRFRGDRNRNQTFITPFFHSYDLSEDQLADVNLITDPQFGLSEEAFARVSERQQFAGLRLGFQSNTVAIPLLSDNGVKYNVFAGTQVNLGDTDRMTTNVGGNFTLYRMVMKAINFATRIGFEHVEGDPEFYQLATLGGRTNYRAARAERYRGNTMFYQNIDIRGMGFQFGKGEAPTVAGYILGLDYARVWLDGEDSDVWHVGYGGGVWAAPLGATIFSLTYFQDTDDQFRIAFAAGFPF